MPKYKNSFTAPTHFEETILDANDKVIGTIRIKPVSVLWKPKGQQKFFAVDLETFSRWITSPATGASRTAN
jgi:hypothetical protein